MPACRAIVVALEAELTPKRLLNYLIGERDADKCGRLRANADREPPPRYLVSKAPLGEDR